jgi:hypothetical protein
VPGSFAWPSDYRDGTRHRTVGHVEARRHDGAADAIVLPSRYHSSHLNPLPLPHQLLTAPELSGNYDFSTPKDLPGPFLARRHLDTRLSSTGSVDPETRQSPGRPPHPGSGEGIKGPANGMSRNNDTGTPSRRGNADQLEANRRSPARMQDLNGRREGDGQDKQDMPPCHQQHHGRLPLLPTDAETPETLGHSPLGLDHAAFLAFWAGHRDVASPLDKRVGRHGYDDTVPWLEGDGAREESYI